MARGDDEAESAPKSAVEAELLEAFVRAFRDTDAKSMFRYYRELSKNGVKINQIRFMLGRAWFSFKDPDGNSFSKKPLSG
ncbi:hypothetical protein [Paenibacillus cymbidii]|uniref:hypothetical protein n=1 Tax=Paenibacillus cymbidii TaxID=1639034 RepID=UPI001080A049|nr:hypothetical protein [Paenibacillus cymbidii]